MEQKEQYWYDFYFNGKFIGRFNTYKQAKKLVTWNENLTYPEDLWKIVSVKREKITRRK